MTAKKQFFNATTSRRGVARTNRAIYQVHSGATQGKVLSIAVECVEGGGNVPRNATSLRGVTAKLDLQEELESVAAVATTVLEKLKALRPGAVEIEFGVELGGEMGIPLVTRGEAKANFKITLKWGESGDAA